MADGFCLKEWTSIQLRHQKTNTKKQNKKKKTSLKQGLSRNRDNAILTARDGRNHTEGDLCWAQADFVLP